MMFDEKINYCILHNNPDENFINKLGSIPVVKDLEFNKLVERLEFFPNKQVIFNETLYGLKLDEKMKIFKLLKKQNISYINVTSNVEDAIYSDYIFVYDGNKLVLEGNRNEVLKEEKVPGICILVDTNNKRAVRFYEKMGFKAFEENPGIMLCKLD